MRKIQEKRKIYNIQEKAPTPPQTIRMAKTNCEYVGQLSLGVDVSHLNVSLLYIISQEVVSSLNMTHLFVKDWIFGY
jgi:hypothetical protein